MMEEGALLWTPSAAFADQSNLTAYMRWLGERGLRFGDYDALWRWSIEDIDAFWSSLWDYFEVICDGSPEPVRRGDDFESQRWFPGARINYAEHVLRHEQRAGEGEAALVHLTETRPLSLLGWAELGQKVRLGATRLRELGILPGDRVVSYMPNVPETVIAMLSTLAVGAVWSAAAPEFGTATVIDRFAQIEPKLMFAANGYAFGGKIFDRVAQVEQITAALPSLERVIWLDYLEGVRPRSIWPDLDWDAFLTGEAPDAATFEYERVGCDHPMWILFSSGTTGLPKPIVHSHVGMLLEHLRGMVLQIDLKPGDRNFFYSTTGWMMWNAAVSSLLAGAAVVLYDGNPLYPDAGALWRIAAQTKTTCFGLSPTLIRVTQQADIIPGKSFDLSALKCVLLGGAPATPDVHAWVYANVGQDIWAAPQSGGTDLCGGLVMSVPTQPVFAGEFQARALGMDVDCWADDGTPLIDAVGELVVKKPFPSMPLYFWNDPGGERYHQSYFDTFPGVWRHGDLFKLNRRGGCFIYGRSDATLNRFGVRIGTAEIYAALDLIPEVDDGLVVCVEQADGTQFMPLFVTMRDGAVLDDDLIHRIGHVLKTEYSPRHVPDMILAVPQVPYTMTGKRMEVPVRRLLSGAPVEQVASRDLMSQPDALGWYADFAQRRLTQERSKHG